jgi:hypothetical protein
MFPDTTNRRLNKTRFYALGGNKLRFLADRFLVGFMGADGPIHAIDEIIRQNDIEDLKAEFPDSVTLINRVGEWAKGWATVQGWERHGNTEKRKVTFAEQAKETSSLIVFDSQEFRMFEVRPRPSIST